MANVLLGRTIHCFLRLEISLYEMIDHPFISFLTCFTYVHMYFQLRHCLEQAVVLLPFIDEPRLLRILAPLLARLKLHEKVRRGRMHEKMMEHVQSGLDLMERRSVKVI